MSDWSGANWIGGVPSSLGGQTYRAMNPALREPIEPDFHWATEGEIDLGADLASRAFLAYSEIGKDDRAAFLEAIAEEIIALGDALLERASAETGLPMGRLTGERGRTVGQLQMYANLVREGSWVDARIDRAQPDRQPLRKPDLRRMLRPIGPVAVFGASNFPLAFSVAGGDTASALAAGCPVVVKVHPAHPGTSELVGRAILKAAERCGMPDGVFSMIHANNEGSVRLVTHSAIEAVGFTGSLQGGRALFDAANQRPKPIPVFAEMGSVNPVFVMPGALGSRGNQIAEGYAQSLLMGVGQFCTNPGIVVGIRSSALSAFIEQAAVSAHQAAGVMLTSQIAATYAEKTGELSSRANLRNAMGDRLDELSPALFVVSGSDFLANDSLRDEVFGPSGIVVECEDADELLEVARSFEGQLTATIHCSEGEDLHGLLGVLEKVAGRIVWNGFPTGVEVCPSMQHGGPYPASTDGRFTSVGTAAILRFARPISYQDMPQGNLRPELQDSNPYNILRTVDGAPTRDPL